MFWETGSWMDFWGRTFDNEDSLLVNAKHHEQAVSKLLFQAMWTGLLMKSKTAIMQCQLLDERP